METKETTAWDEFGVRDLYPVIEVSGSPLEMGRQHGEKAKEQISRMLEYCFGHTTKRIIGGMERDVIVHTEGLLPLAEDYAPDLVEECRGIAEGAGHDFREVFCMQYFVDFLPPSRTAAIGCSTALAVESAHQNGHVLLGWNDDMSVYLAPATIILHSIPDNGPTITGICFAGTIPECGATKDRVIACNSLPGAQPVEGVPYLFIPRKALQQETFPDAISVIASARRVCGMNFLLASKSGNFVDIETIPGEYHLDVTMEDFYAHTNHCLSPEFRLRQDLPPAWNSQTRHMFLQRFLRRNKGAVTEENMVEALSDHDSRLCNHGRGSTVTCMICDLTAGRVAFSTGPPCLGRFQELSL